MTGSGGQSAEGLSATANDVKDNRPYLEVLSNLTDKTLEGELADKQLGRLLVATDFTEVDGTGAETVRLLHTTGRSRGLSLARLGSELLARGLACNQVVKPSPEHLSVENAYHQWTCERSA